MAFIIFSISVIASFLFAGFETGFISWNHYKIEKRAQEGLVTARWALILQNNRAKVLTTVLVGNNIALVLMENSFSTITISFGLILPAIVKSLILTLFVVFFCELLPKSLFRIYSFRLTYSTVPILILCYFFVYPFSFIFEKLSRIMSGSKTSDSMGGSAYAIAFEGSRREILPSRLVPLLEHVQREKSVLSFIEDNNILQSEKTNNLAFSVSKDSTMKQLIDEEQLFKVDQIFDVESQRTYNTTDILHALFL